jgi:hypothetical protein
MSANPLEDLVAQRSERWNDYQGMEESNLLRLAILRDLSRDLHLEKSKCLAQGNRDQAKEIKVWEDKLELLRTAGKLDGALMEVFSTADRLKKRTRLLPQQLFSYVEKEKFERYDRLWENEIAAEAASLGWNFWTLDTWVQIEKVEDWNTALSDGMLPHGVILFCEAVQDAAAVAGFQDHWKGRWLIVMKPDFKEPSISLEHLPGVSQKPTPPHWKLLFSSKKS